MTASTATESGDVTVAGSVASAADSAASSAVTPVAESATSSATPPVRGFSAAGLAAAVAGLDADRRAPGRPRSARADEAIIEATLDLMAEGSTIEAISMEAVATRAGVGKATIYRRWSNKESLVIDALAALKGPLPEIAGESVRDDLLTLLLPIGTPMSTRAGRIMPCIIPELKRNPEMAASYHKITEPRRELMRDVLRRGITTGELRADIDLDVAVAMLTGPMLAQSVLGSQPAVDIKKLPEQIVDTMLPGLRA